MIMLPHYQVGFGLGFGDPSPRRKSCLVVLVLVMEKKAHELRRQK